jgi:hypothetical protein
MSQWTVDDFVKTMRFGLTPDGHVIGAKYMPWLGYRNMTDDELRSIWEYLRSLPSETATRADGPANLSR